MMFKASSLPGYAVQATDGAIGCVTDLLFDDRSWKIRWLVVDTGLLMPGRRVLIHPSAVAGLAHGQDQLLMSLTRAQIEGSPDLRADASLSRGMEANLHDYYGWDPAWGEPAFGHNAIASPFSAPPLIGGEPEEEAVLEGADDEGDPHLRSMLTVIGYTIQASDGQIGHVEDFQADDRAWVFRYLVADTRKWWSGVHVLVSPRAVLGFDAKDHAVRIAMTQDQLRASPPWNPDNPVGPEYEQAAHHQLGWDSAVWGGGAAEAAPVRERD